MQEILIVIATVAIIGNVTGYYKYKGQWYGKGSFLLPMLVIVGASLAGLSLAERFTWLWLVVATAVGAVAFLLGANRAFREREAAQRREREDEEDRRAHPVSEEDTMFKEVRGVILDRLSLSHPSLRLKYDDVALKTSPKDDLGADSLDLVELTIMIESRYEIQIPDEEAEKLFTFEDIVRFVKKKLAEKSSATTGVPA